MFATILNTFLSFLSRLKVKFEKITRPATASLTTGILSDVPRSKYDLIIENAILRQQLIVLDRSVKRPNLMNSDRIRLTFLARLTNFWPSALLIVQPETLLR
jgi:putative transposase